MTIILMIQMHSWGEEVAASPNCWVIKFYNTWQWSISHFSGLNKVWLIVQTVVMPPSLSWSPGLQLVRPPATTHHYWHVKYFCEIFSTDTRCGKTNNVTQSFSLSHKYITNVFSSIFPSIFIIQVVGGFSLEFWNIFVSNVLVGKRLL